MSDTEVTDTVPYLSSILKLKAPTEPKKIVMPHRLQSHIYSLTFVIFGKHPKNPSKHHIKHNAEVLDWFNALYVPADYKYVPTKEDLDVMVNWKFYNKKLTANQKKEFQAWVEDSSDDFDFFLTETLKGKYKIGVSADETMATFTASLTPTKSNKINSGGSLIGMHADYMTAIWIVLYKHIVLCSSGKWDDMIVDNEDWG